jgi:hypothetical protein
MKTKKRGKKNKIRKKKKESKVGKLQAQNWVPIPVCIFQPSSYQLQSPLVPIAYEKKTNPHLKVNQTKETMQINNTINLLNRKTDLNLFMACILQASQSQKKFCKIERIGERQQVGFNFPTHRIKSFPTSTPRRMVPSCDSFKLVLENPSALQFSK